MKERNRIESRVRLVSVLMLVCVALYFISCKDDKDEPKKDENQTSNLTLDISGLEDLGDKAAYEGWIIVDGKPVTTGTFEVDEKGKLSKTTFSLSKAMLDKATAFVLTIEPKPDTDPAPSKVHILAGDFSSASASLTVGHKSALNEDFSSVVGKYVLATPTDGDDEKDEESGLWFLDNSSGSAEAGLVLPELPEGWAYEGWAVIDGKPVSTGVFTAVDKADAAAPYSGTTAGPAYPGEDFLMSAPEGLTFPVDIRGGKAVISVEPVPDNSAAPFLLKPLVSDISATAETHSVIDMNQNLTFPTGQAKR